MVTDYLASRRVQPGGAGDAEKQASSRQEDVINPRATRREETRRNYSSINRRSLTGRLQADFPILPVGKLSASSGKISAGFQPANEQP